MKELKGEFKEAFDKMMAHLEEHNVKVILQDADKYDYVDPDIGVTYKINGVFLDDLDNDCKNKVLGVATKKATSKWMSVMLHEYCHFLQLLDKEPLYFNTKIDDEWSATIYEEWLEGKDFPDDIIRKAIIDHTMYMELDCEKRRIELVKKWNLPYDIAYETQTSNSYMFFHHVTLGERKWYVKSPWDLPHVIAAMPDTFDIDYDKCPEDIYKIIKDNCF